MSTIKYYRTPSWKIIVVFLIVIYLFNVVMMFVYQQNFALTNILIWAILEAGITTILFLVFFWLFSRKKEEEAEIKSLTEQGDNIDAQ
jgi:c-di-AMP phosphodiesterase-like protein